MKHFYHLVILFLFVLALMFWIESETRYRDFEQRVEAELEAKDLRMQQIEKEIRLLKTDLDITKNGFSDK